MASEITMTGSASVARGGYSASASASKTTNVETALVGIGMHTTQIVGTSATMEAVTTGDVNTAAQMICFLKNTDASNYVEISSTTSNANNFALMLAGESWGPSRLPASKVPYMRANAANVNVEVFVCEAGDPAA
jgi:hypothetical protein